MVSAEPGYQNPYGLAIDQFDSVYFGRDDLAVSNSVSKLDSNGNLVWTREIIGADELLDVVADSLGAITVAGYTQGNLAGRVGGFDAYLRQYDAEGNVRWTRQFGTSKEDTGGAVAADSLGNVYFAGGTQGSMQGQNAGGFDAFVTKFDHNGTRLWTRQTGTELTDSYTDIAVDDSDNIYLASATSDLRDQHATRQTFVTKYDSVGTMLWKQGLPGTGVVARDLEADELGNVYIAGAVFEAFDDDYGDAFVSKLDAAGNWQWTHDLDFDTLWVSPAIAVDDAGNIVLGGGGAGSQGGWIVSLRDSIPGDFNADGTVDAADYIVWRKGLDTDYTQADYDQWRANFGQTAGASTSALIAAGGSHPAVPEPSTVILAFFVLVFCSLRTRAFYVFSRRVRGFGFAAALPPPLRGGRETTS
jgi:hypothetical protein